MAEQFELNFRPLRGILAMSKNRCIGKNNTLPWLPLKEDFKWFKEFTLNKTLLMGRKTYENIPYLKNRTFLILTDNKSKLDTQFIFDKHDNTMLYGRYIDCKFITECIDNNITDFILAGGKSIYEKYMPSIGEFYVTVIDKEYEGDTFISPFEHLFSKQEVIREFEFGKVIKYSK